jgi:hypothetical protein
VIKPESEDEAERADMDGGAVVRIQPGASKPTARLNVVA